MSDWGQGFPRDPPGMVPTHFQLGRRMKVGKRHRTEGRSLGLEQGRDLIPLTPTLGRPRAQMGAPHSNQGRIQISSTK